MDSNACQICTLLTSTNHIVGMIVVGIKRQLLGQEGTAVHYCASHRHHICKLRSHCCLGLALQGLRKFCLCTCNSLASDKNLRIGSLLPARTFFLRYFSIIHDKALQIYRMPRFQFRVPTASWERWCATIESCHLCSPETGGAVDRHLRRIKLTAKRYRMPLAQVRNCKWFCNLIQFKLQNSTRTNQSVLHFLQYMTSLYM